MKQTDRQTGGIWNRLVDDLNRPGGGWTTGVLTLIAAIIGPIIYLAGYWSGPGWSVAIAVFGFLFTHIIWASYGYYPKVI